jgi:hypothetical protein
MISPWWTFVWSASRRSEHVSTFHARAGGQITLMVANFLPTQRFLRSVDIMVGVPTRRIYHKALIVHVRFVASTRGRGGSGGGRWVIGSRTST